MKKILTICFCLLLATGLLAACGTGGETPESDPAATVPAANAPVTFTTTTLAGESFSNEDLTPYDLTLIVIWTSWCNVCVGEIPQIEQVYQQLPENYNLISICMDADDPEVAAEITDYLAETGATYPVLLPTAELADAYAALTSGYPANLYVDSEGAVIGEPVVGAMRDAEDNIQMLLDGFTERAASLTE